MLLLKQSLDHSCAAAARSARHLLLASRSLACGTLADHLLAWDSRKASIPADNQSEKQLHNLTKCVNELLLLMLFAAVVLALLLFT